MRDSDRSFPLNGGVPPLENDVRVGDLREDARAFIAERAVAPLAKAPESAGVVETDGDRTGREPGKGRRSGAGVVMNVGEKGRQVSTGRKNV
jgi:hypothetical protein